MATEQQIAALCQELAEMEVDCHHDKVQAWDTPEGIKNCPDCSGTGKVPLFPGVRVPCPVCKGGIIWVTHKHADGSKIVCAACDVRGWVASRDLAVWLEVATTLGYPFFLAYTGEGWEAFWDHPDDPLNFAQSSSPLLAPLLAMKEAMDAAH